VYYVSVGWREDTGRQIEERRDAGESPVVADIEQLAADLYLIVSAGVDALLNPQTDPLYDPLTGELIPPQQQQQQQEASLP